MGMGAGHLHVPAVAIQAHHWHARRAFAMASLLHRRHHIPNHAQSALQRLDRLRASAFVVLGLLVLANFLMTPNPAVHAQDRPKPNIKVVLTDAPYLIATFAVFLIDWGISFPYFYLQLFAILHGVDSNIALYSLAIINASSMPGRILPNMLADSFGPFNAVISCVVVCAALLFPMIGIKTIGTTIVFAILYGFVSGASPAIASLSHDPNEVGIRFGIAFFLTAFGALTGTPINGTLLGTDFPWSKAIVFSGVAVVAGVLGLIITRQLLVKRKGTQLV
ncbi:hypothetical protein EW146_g6593 [Bondarzewia mesenterica]|uniref:Major facilitator superfamily (MFS) profile domain-containing protein n=1 Tax=Bondarzewia mesenterica TaxID=1095465 RepID=A0A4S4LP08_9AGAM|nr:hypothetical protein EW146_g6593 [Bondarzewia mesenterica]